MQLFKSEIQAVLSHVVQQLDYTLTPLLTGIRYTGWLNPFCLLMYTFRVQVFIIIEPQHPQVFILLHFSIK